MKLSVKKLSLSAAVAGENVSANGILCHPCPHSSLPLMKWLFSLCQISIIVMEGERRKPEIGEIMLAAGENESTKHHRRRKLRAKERRKPRRKLKKKKASQRCTRWHHGTALNVAGQLCGSMQCGSQ